jgi:hypothetical protein
MKGLKSNGPYNPVTFVVSEGPEMVKIPEL